MNMRRITYCYHYTYAGTNILEVIEQAADEDVEVTIVRSQAGEVVVVPVEVYNRLLKAACLHERPENTWRVREFVGELVLAT